MKQKMVYAALLTLAVMLCVPAALAAGRMTQTYSPNWEENAAFWSYMQETMAPWLAQNPQEKWSAQRCRQAADKLEEGGFVIPEAYKDKLYRQEREHRWHAGEAMSILISSQIGEEWCWSLEDAALMKQTYDAAAIIGSSFVLPPQDGPALEEVAALCRTQVQREYGLSEAEIQAYDLRIFLSSYGEDVLWTVNFTPDMTQEFYQLDIACEYYWPSGECTSVDFRR